VTQQISLADGLKHTLAAWAADWRLSFRPGELRTLGERLYRLAVQVAGEPEDEEHVTDPDAVEEWAVQAAREGLGRHLRRLADQLGELGEAPVHWLDEKLDAPVTLGRWGLRLELSGASTQDLRKLPGLSGIRTRRAHRRPEGGRGPERN